MSIPKTKMLRAVAPSTSFSCFPWLMLTILRQVST